MSGPTGDTDRPRDDDEVLPEQTADDTDRGWGDDQVDDEVDDDERLRREKPPHW